MDVGENRPAEYPQGLDQRITVTGLLRRAPAMAPGEFGQLELRVASTGRSGEWRNWQTRRIQVPVSERMWGFKSPLAHRGVPTKLIGSYRQNPLHAGPSSGSGGMSALHRGGPDV